jgi:hypothetical protein
MSHLRPEVPAYNPRLDWMVRQAQKHGLKYGVGDLARRYWDDQATRNWVQMLLRTAGEGRAPLDPLSPSLKKEGQMKTAQTGSPQQTLDQEAMRKLLSIALMGGGLGVSARALMGLRNLLRESRPSVESTSSVPTSVPVPIPVEGPEKMAAQATCPSCGKPFPKGEPYPDVKNCEACERYGPPKEAAGPLVATGRLLKQAQGLHVRPSGRVTWWQIPAAVGAGGLGIYGGWKLLDWVLKAQKKRQESSELTDAKREYEDAMRQQYLTALQGKAGEFSGLDDIFDRFIAPIEKQAQHGLGDTIGDFAHGGLGAYLTALGIVAGTGGLAGYRWARSRSKQKATDKALRIRRQLRQSPQPIYAYAVPFPVHHPTNEALEEEEEAR